MTAANRRTPPQGTVGDLFQRLEQLNAIGAALSSERDINRLLENILVAVKDITHADGGTLYRVSENQDSLRFEILRNDSLKIALGGTSGNPIDFPDLPFTDEKGAPNNHMVAVYAALHGETVNIEDAYTARGFDFSGTRKFDQRTGYRSQSFLTVPMRNHENNVIGVLQLINSLDRDTHRVVPFSAADQRLVESLSSQAAIALTNRLLISQLEQLFESLIGLINLAIDEKSPYTGGHCERVPILTMLLAEAADQSATGELAGFRMSEQDRYELKIAGLLHDCGKVTTPVHVVDKSTKLQTLYDRINTIDTRFEVLKRDAEIELLRGQLALRVPQDLPAEETLRAACAARIAQYDSDREFLRHANVGGEFMQDADLQRVREIGSGCRWRNVAGVATDFLSADEIENLSIRAG
ncbi:MAG: GAF domain-containing protein, partial [Proteobacteria bacterium]|nr:GAF domain-containing protein [Pseudomonadota bacterium]